MSHNSNRVFAGTLLAGTACGGALILITVFSRNGWLMLLPYVALALVSAAYLSKHRMESFGERFVLPFGAYVVATLIIEAYIQTAQRQFVRPLTLRNSIGPFGVMLLIGVVGSAVIAFLVGLRSGGKRVGSAAYSNFTARGR
jgi:hypothetical protein